MLRLANVLMHALHLAVISFSTLGWIWPQTRALHLALAAGVAAAWFVLGPLVGRPGICILTEIQHRIWARMGRTEMPSYMSLLYQRVAGHPGDSKRIDRVTQVVFYSTTLASVVLLAS